MDTRFLEANLVLTFNNPEELEEAVLILLRDAPQDHYFMVSRGEYKLYASSATMESLYKTALQQQKDAENDG